MKRSSGFLLRNLALANTASYRTSCRLPILGLFHSFVYQDHVVVFLLSRVWSPVLPFCLHSRCLPPSHLIDLSFFLLLLLSLPPLCLPAMPLKAEVPEPKARPTGPLVCFVALTSGMLTCLLACLVGPGNEEVSSPPFRTVGERICSDLKKRIRLLKRNIVLKLIQSMRCMMTDQE